jgi:hypothetical protein
VAADDLRADDRQPAPEGRLVRPGQTDEVGGEDVCRQLSGERQDGSARTALPQPTVWVLMAVMMPLVAFVLYEDEPVRA